MGFLVMRSWFQHATGRAYGFELLGRVKEFMKINLVFSYTFVRSEFHGS